MMCWRNLILLLVGLLAGCGRVETRDPSVARPSTTAEQGAAATGRAANDSVNPAASVRAPLVINDPAVVEERLASDLRYLASDELGGRGPFSEGLEKAADHIAREFAAAGLHTRLYGDSPFQVFRSTVKQSLGTVNTLRLRSANASERDAEQGEEFVPLSLSASGTFDLPLVFAGYGITRADIGWDDYRDLNVKGAMVIVLRHEPPAAPGTNAKTRDGGLSDHAHLARKVANARAHGAAGVMFVTDSHHLSRPASSKEQRAASSVRESTDPLLGFQVEGREDKDNGPVVHVRREVVDQLLAQLGRPSLTDCEAVIATDRVPCSFPLTGCRASGTVTIQRRRLTLKNVVASLPGRGPHADEVVVVGAHYDHLGTGGMASLAPWTVAIHNGADDNGSGSAALLEVARHVAARRGQQSRQILFVAFSAEEMGLIGSERFVAAPPVAMRDIAAMVNLDMVGRLRNDRLTVAGTGTASSFPQLVTRLGSEHRFRVRLDPSGFGPSDHASFCAQGVPVLHFFTGLHEDYHRPSDDFDKINIDGLRRIVGMVSDTVLEIAQADERPRGISGQLAARRTTNERRGGEVSTPPAAATKPNSRGVGITIENRPEGVVRITRVAPGSPAQSAQLRPGDIVRQVQGTPISSGEQIIARVKEVANTGKVTFRVERGETQLEVDLTLRTE